MGAKCKAFLKHLREIEVHIVCGILKKAQSVLILNNPFRNNNALCLWYSWYWIMHTKSKIIDT